MASQDHLGGSFRFDQDRVEEICQVPTEVAEGPDVVINDPARLYGIGSVLNRYAGLPEAEPFPCSVDHLVAFEEGKSISWDVGRGFPTHLAVTRRRARAYRRAGIQRALPVGHAIHYAVRLFESRFGGLPSSHSRQGTLVFPHKSDAVVKERRFDHSRLIDWLLELPEFMQPVTVCLYWKDWLKGDGEDFLAAGFPLVSCGHWTHDDFLLRFVDLASRNRFAIANAFGSSFPLSVVCGCHFLYRELEGFEELQASGSQTFDGDPLVDTPIGRKAKRVTSDPLRSRDLHAQARLVDRITGRRFLLSPESLHRILKRELFRLQETREVSISFGDSPVSWSLLRPWGTDGLECDGWMHSRCVVSPPHGSGYVELTVEFPAWAGISRHNLVISLENGSQKNSAQFAVAPGRYLLRIPLPEPTGNPPRLVLTSAETFPLPGEERVVWGRLRHLEIYNLPPDDTKITLQPD